MAWNFPVVPLNHDNFCQHLNLPWLVTSAKIALVCQPRLQGALYTSTGQPQPRSRERGNDVIRTVCSKTRDQIMSSIQIMCILQVRFFIKFLVCKMHKKSIFEYKKYFCQKRPLMIDIYRTLWKISTNSAIELT